MPFTFSLAPTSKPLPQSRLPDPRTRVEIPLQWSGVSAGFPSSAEDYEEKGLDFNDLLIHNPSSTQIIEARGDSMKNAGIFEGDLLVVDRSMTPRKGDIVIMRIDTRFTVKRLMYDAAGIVYLHPENEAYEDLYPNEFEEWECYGVVTSSIRRLTHRSSCTSS